MATLSISLPDAMCKFLEEQVASGAYGSASEYIQELLRQAQEHAEQERLEQLLLEGLDSPASEMTSADWEEIRRTGMDRLSAPDPK